MKTSNAGNAPNTDTTSGNEPDKPKPASESEYLAQQAEQAKQAISRAIDELKDHLAKGTDPRLWMKQYPWASLGAAAVVGFLASSAMVPSREQQALKKLAELEKTLHPYYHGGDGQPPPKPDQHPYLKGFVRQLMTAAKPAVMSALTAAVSQAMHQARESEAQEPADEQPPPGHAGKPE